MSDFEYRTEPSMDSYNFTPSLDSEGIIDYTGVHPDKIYLASRKTILAEELPSFLPPVEIRRDQQYDIPAFKEGENSYLLRGSDTMYRDEAGNFHNPRIYRVSLDVYAALIHYHLEYDRAAFQAIAKQNEEFRLKAIEAGAKEYKTIKENEVPLIPQKLDVSSLQANQRNWNTSVENKASRVSLWSTKSNRMNVEPFYFIQDMSKAQGAQYPRNAIFKLHRVCLEDVNQKILDMEAQKADWESSWTKGRETSYGDNGLNDSLYAEYGVMVKRQNGESITREEIEDIRGSIQRVHSIFGNISGASREYGLKLSHAGDTNMHASKYVGLFTPYYKAIGVSFKGGSIEAGLTAVHEYAHFLDHLSGKELNAWHASDVPGTFENQIAVSFRGQMNEVKGAYWNRTCECFARAMEEYAHISILRERDGIDGFSFSSIESVNKEVSKPAYVNYLAFQEHLEPLITNLIEHYRERFAVETEETAERIDSSPQKEDAVKTVEKQNILISDSLTNDQLQRRIYNLALEKSKLDKEVRRVSELISAEKRALFDEQARLRAHEVGEIDRQILILSDRQGNSQLIAELEARKSVLYEQYNSLRNTFVPESDKLTQFIENEAGIEQRLSEIEIEGRALTHALMDREENEKIAKKNEIERKMAIGSFTQLELFEPGTSYVEDDTAQYYNGDLFTEGDPALTREHIREAKAAARSYSLPVLNGEKTGLWTKFSDFEKHGVFDILGAKVATGSDGNISMAGWQQLHQAMQIYRDKRFETFRVLFISPEGEIKDQVIVSSRLPNRVFVGPLFGLGVEQIINQAIESNTRIVVAHNHPSGNIEPSEADKYLTEKLKSELIDKEGNSLFVGHIILDHDMFGLYRADDWYSILGKAQERDPLLKKDLPGFLETSIVGPGFLKTVAESINENEEWNTKDWVPVLFTDGNSRVSSVSCYSRDWFVNTPSKAIVEELRIVGVAAGANNAYPVLSGENAQDSRLVDAVFDHYGNGCFKDFYLEGVNLTDYRTIDFGRGIFDGISTDEIIERTTVESTNGIERTFMTLDEYLEKVSSEETMYSPDGSTPFRVITDPGLYGEIDGVSRADIGKVNSFIKITDKTPYILKLNGLPDKQITMYRDKFARALFLDPAIPGYRPTHGHADGLDKELVRQIFDSLANPYYIFASKDEKSLIGVYDIADRNGEPVMVAFRHRNDHNTVEANWITSLYGKSEAGIARWAEEGLLRYVNDKEKAVELTFTLQMRVKDNSAAYSKNILHKSEVVNESSGGTLEIRSPGQNYDLFTPEEIEPTPVVHRPVGQYELLFIEDEVFSVDIANGFVYLRGADGTVQYELTTDNTNLPSPAQLMESYLMSKNENLFTNMDDENSIEKMKDGYFAIVHTDFGKRGQEFETLKEAADFADSTKTFLVDVYRQTSERTVYLGNNLDEEPVEIGQVEEEKNLTEALKASYYNIEETEAKENTRNDSRSEGEKHDDSRTTKASSEREVSEGRERRSDDLFQAAGYAGFQERSDILQPERRADIRPDRYTPIDEELSQDSQFDDRDGGGSLRPESVPEGGLGGDRGQPLVSARESRNGNVSARSLRDIRSECLSILESKKDNEITSEDRLVLAMYEGAGGLNERQSSAAGVLSEFYTPEPVIKKVWELVDAYAPGAKTVMEPSAGTGRFAEGREQNSFTLHELDETSSRIAKILHPEAIVIPGAFQKQFFDPSGRVLKKGYTPPTYDVVIGNPPYGAYSGTWKGLGEGGHHNRYEEYFIEKGLDSLNQDGILAFVVPSGFLRSGNDSIKELIASKGVLIDAWRLPNGAFPTTDVGTDIILMKVGVSDSMELSNDNFFIQNPDHILGTEGERRGRFGTEKYVSFTNGKNLESALEGIIPSNKLIAVSTIRSNEQSSQNEASISKRPNETEVFQEKGKILQRGTITKEPERNSGVKGKLLSTEEFSARYGKDHDPRAFPIWAATSWNGRIELEKLTDESRAYLSTSPDYVEERPGLWVHKILYASGNVVKKIDDLENLYEQKGIPEELYKRNIAILVDSLPKAIPLQEIQFSPMATLASEFIVTNEKGDELTLKDGFIDWVIGSGNEGMHEYYRRRNFDPALSPLNKEDIPSTIRWSDIIDYLDGESVRADRSYNEDSKKANKIEAEQKRIERRETADRLFNRYIQEGLSDKDSLRLEEEWNARFNNNVNPDYSQLPLFVDGMAEYKGEKPFRLYEQQIKGISFLANKGNGLLAYDVGVGKTAAGIVSTVNQIQTGRATRPLIIVPKSVYSKWARDIKELFPNIPINELGNFSTQNLERYRTDDYGLNIPENSISLCTIEALQSISFTDSSISGPLFNDFSNLLGVSDDGGSERERKIKEEKISESVGRASQTKDGFVFWERTGFDHVTVDEAHRFKNLFKTPRSSEKGKANEYNGLGAGNPSARALKLFGITQLVQRENDNRNVFLLTATPFTNSPLEVYSMMSYMGRERLKEMHLYNLKSFLDEFAEMKSEWAVDAKGSIQTRQVMKNFRSLPALQNLLREYIDKVDGEEAGVIRPLKFTHIEKLEATVLQRQIIEAETARMLDKDAQKDGAVLVAMNNMRMAMLSPALLKDVGYPFAIPPLSQMVECSPKLTLVCDTIVDNWKKVPTGGQIMYMPRGVEESKYVKDYLVRKGVPENVIGFINSGVTDTKKDSLTEAFNDKTHPLKVIIGSETISEGVDLNGNTYALYNTMLGWNPSETVQVEGRLWRQGNEQGHVHVVYPLMNDSIDALMYQKYDEKSSRINALWSFKGNKLNVEDINPEELKFDLVKDPAKKADFILAEKTVDLRSESVIITGKLETINSITELRKSLLEDIENRDTNIEYWEKERRGPRGESSFYDTMVKNVNEKAEKAKRILPSVSRKLEGMGLNNDEEIAEYVRALNERKIAIDSEIADVYESKDEIIHQLTEDERKKQVLLPSLSDSHSSLVAKITGNLRAMSEIEDGIRSSRDKLQSLVVEREVLTFSDESSKVSNNEIFLVQPHNSDLKEKTTTGEKEDKAFSKKALRQLSLFDDLFTQAEFVYEQPSQYTRNEGGERMELKEPGKANESAAAKEVNDSVKDFYDALGLDYNNTKPDPRVDYFEDFYKSIAVDPHEPILAEGKSLYSTILSFENTEKWAGEGKDYESDAATILALGYFDEAGSSKPKGIDEFLASNNFDLDNPEVAEALARVKYERSVFLEQGATNDKTQEHTVLEPKKPYSQVNTESFLNFVKNDTAPFLVNTSNVEANTVSILPTAIRSAESGRIFRGMNQILAQTALAEMGGKDTEIITYEQAKRHGAGIKKGSQGINLTTFDMGTHTQKVWRYYPRSAVYNRDKLPAIPEQEKSSLVIKCTETTPERYLAKYLAATSLGARFETTKDAMTEFKKNIIEDVQDHYLNGKYTRIYELGNKASVICQNTINEIAKEKEAEKKRVVETKKEKVIRVARTVPYNPVTGEKFVGVNEQKAEFVMQQRQSKDPRFLEITDILKAGLSLKKDVSDRLVISVNGKSRFFYNAADVEGIPPRSAAITRDTGIKDRKVQRAQEMDMGL